MISCSLSFVSLAESRTVVGVAPECPKAARDRELAEGPDFHRHRARTQLLPLPIDLSGTNVSPTGDISDNRSRGKGRRNDRALLLLTPRPSPLGAGNNLQSGHLDVSCTGASTIVCTSATSDLCSRAGARRPSPEGYASFRLQNPDPSEHNSTLAPKRPARTTTGASFCGRQRSSLWLWRGHPRTRSPPRGHCSYRFIRDISRLRCRTGSPSPCRRRLGALIDIYRRRCCWRYCRGHLCLWLATQPETFTQRRTSLGISRGGERMIAPQSPTLQVFILPAGLRGRTAASVREEPAGGPTSRGLAQLSTTMSHSPSIRSSSSGATRTAAIGCWIWYAGGPTRATSRDCCSIPRRRTATGSASGSARIRGRPARARRFTWSAPEPKVRRLSAGGEWIRTIGSPSRKK